MLEAGVPLTYVQHQVGHENTKTTQEIYTVVQRPRHNAKSLRPSWPAQDLPLTPKADRRVLGPAGQRTLVYGRETVTVEPSSRRSRPRRAASG